MAGASFFAFDRPLKAAGRLLGAAPATRDFDVLQAGSFHLQTLYYLHMCIAIRKWYGRRASAYMYGGSQHKYGFQDGRRLFE